MKLGTIYLIGPIGGLSYEQATGWRIEARNVLEDMGWEVFDPMSGKECLQQTQDIGVDLANEKTVENGYIYHSDLRRINRADILLANWLIASHRPPIGTMFEYGYASAKDKCIITVSTDDYFIKHPFVVNSSIIVSTMEEAYEAVTAMGV